MEQGDALRGDAGPHDDSTEQQFGKSPRAAAHPCQRECRVRNRDDERQERDRHVVRERRRVAESEHADEVRGQMPIPIATAPLASQYHLAFLRSACERCAVAYRDAVTRAAESSATYAA